MRHSREEAIRIGRQVDSRELRLQVQHRTNERRILVTETVMLLPRPRRGLDVVETPDRLPPFGLTGHLDELAVLDHHGLDDTQEGFVGGEEARATGEGVALHEALAGVFGEDLDDATATRGGRRVPLEVATAGVKDGVELI